MFSVTFRTIYSIFLYNLRNLRIEESYYIYFRKRLESSGHYTKDRLVEYI